VSAGTITVSPPIEVMLSPSLSQSSPMSSGASSERYLFLDFPSCCVDLRSKQ